ncbi:MAG TPA: ADP-ribosylglycohydrolase family protein [Bacteroidales bacterium]|nr:ADP-ribosylglycohydrolase family protein [Bacteroidales bacterium]
MKRTLVLLIICLVVGSSFGKKPIVEKDEIVITKAQLKDKIKGAWVAQTVGVTFGLPAEFKYNSTMIQDYQKLEWNDSSLIVEYRARPGTYDDIYMDLSFMKVIEEEGVDAPAQSFALSFANADYKLWFANQVARYNILNGLTPPESGHWLNNPCADDIDFQIEADFAGIMNPGMVNSAVEICDKVGHIMNYGDGYYGGVFVASMYSLALTSDNVDDIEDVVKKAISVIPSESTFAQCINDVIKWHDENPSDWKTTWYKVNRKWSEDIGSPLGVFEPFNIDAKINSAWVVMGLLYGDGDFTRTFEIATRCGDDADCNPATAGGVLASIVGYEAIPEFWTQGLDKVEDLHFMGTEYSLIDAYDMSYRHAMGQIEKNGGLVKGDVIRIKPQDPKMIPLEVSFEGHYPIARVFPTVTKDEISFEFDGIGFALAGPPNIKDHGEKNHVFETEMYINGELVEKVKLPTETNKRRFVPFWKYQLPDGKHKVVIKILNPVKHAKIQLKYAIIYGDTPYNVNL